jgi:AraC-like DNA-binding protein
LHELSVQLEVQELRLSPGQEWSTEPNQWRFIFLDSGTAYWLEAAKPRELARGELLIVTPAPEGLIRASQLAEVVLHWFAFRPEALLGFLSVAEREWIEHSATSVLGSVTCLPSTHPLSREMAALRNARQTDSQLLERAKALLLALRVLAQSMPPLDAPLRRGGAAKERFDEIISRMPDAELIQHSSEELARLCGCTPRHFNRLFRVRFGTPTRVRQTELRLLKARQLLEASRQPIAEIAADCGYHSLSLFNSLFRRRFGMSPSEWRDRVSR